jgi:hypothetical protein
VHQVVHDVALDITNIEGMGLSIVSYLIMDVPLGVPLIMDVIYYHDFTLHPKG